MPNRTEAHERVKGLDWSPSYEARAYRYPTKYKIPARTKDPFRHLIRDYCSMEQEKDDRQYGALEDALARSHAPRHASRKWLEILKLVLPAVNTGEYGAMKCMGMLVDTVENAELRQGYQAQMIDEVRHVNQQNYLMRWFSKHAPDPEGFNKGLKYLGRDIFGRAARNCFETFYVGDPVECALNLQVVAETAYTNPIFVALTEVAALQGDEATPSVFLSIQSDEARHMANGYSTLAAIVSEEDNLVNLQNDLNKAFWRQHVFLDTFASGVYDYFQVTRSSSYLEKWNEWVGEDWCGAYISRLEPFGLKAPTTFDLARERVRWCGHTALMLASAIWPMAFWRFDALTDADFEWMEDKYPGWYENYGWYWERYRESLMPGSGIPAQIFPDMPPLCRVCHLPCVFPRLDTSSVRFKEYEGRKHAFCSAPCEQIFDEDPGRYLGYKTFWEIWHGCGLDEYLIEQDLLRPDGKTLVGQPHCSDDPRMMWTIDDIRALGIEIKDPMQSSELPANV